ncbi:MAG: PorV/PorQ family protein [Bacteroidota bacterium]|nr:PorV/PorQ family protein [Bacteroidota bacterium]
MKPQRLQLLFIILLIVLLIPVAVFAQSKVGTTAAQFLGNSVGPRAMAMGSAFVASNDDVTSLYWNPGAFVQANKSEFAFSNSEWLAGTKFRWFGLMLNFDSENAIGITITQLNYGEDDVTTVSMPDGTGEKWTAYDFAAGLSYSRRLTDKFSLGGTVKYVSQRIWNESASNVTFDLGLLFVTDFNGMRLGMSMSNFGGDLTLDGKDLFNRIDIDPTNAGSNKTLVGKLKTDTWPMPLLFRVGVAMDIVKNDMMRATLAIDALRPNDNSESVNVGAELGWMDLVFVRGGYKSLVTQSEGVSNDGQQEGLSLGGGVKYGLQGLMSVEVNYAYTKFGLFGNLNTMAVSISF